ncbi:hypothetical protein B0H65DRAFT_222763 [Neurospora tetraspora]|uniref:Uncharacterized protein n=1 Tax=Neurospora tetraspora TaxID=94610 RepID=A0AAE0JCJ3_9PEZI|nr:hypothetical protein B0H65DRAFT_222763 [Neurospora tetraspora]
MTRGWDSLCLLLSLVQHTTETEYEIIVRYMRALRVFVLFGVVEILEEKKITGNLCTKVSTTVPDTPQDSHGRFQTFLAPCLGFTRRIELSLSPSLFYHSPNPQQTCADSRHRPPPVAQVDKADTTTAPPTYLPYRQLFL